MKSLACLLTNFGMLNQFIRQYSFLACLLTNSATSAGKVSPDCQNKSSGAFATSALIYNV